MSEQDIFPVGETNQPRDMTPEELEEALRWLEDLAGRQGKSLDGLLTLEDTSLEDSPFKGLFDSDEQELPGWLREVPSAEDSVDEVIEGESRLDWLARMSGRESVEELPTLEWRRLTEGEEDEDSDLVNAMPEAAAAIAGLPTVVDEPLPGVIEEMVTLAVVEIVATPDSDNEVIETAEVVEVTPIATVIELPDEAVAESLPSVNESPIIIETIVETEIVALEVPRVIEPDVVVPSPEQMLMGPDDLDEAMAWLEELAASQDAPIEDLPSVADRALASKLIADAASGLSQVEGLDNSQMGIAMSGIYVGKTRLAPTGPLVGNAPADETPDSAIFAEVSLASETDGLDEIVPTEAWIDSGLTAIPEEIDTQTVELSDVALNQIDFGGTSVAEIVTDEIYFEDIGGEVITAEVLTRTFIEEPVVQPVNYREPSLAGPMNGRTLTLPEMLLAVDHLAVPANLSLDEIDTMLAADQMIKITPFSLASTLNWLEGVADSGHSADFLDTSLVADMPDDPDEAQVWLEQLAGDIGTPQPAAKGSIPAEATASNTMAMNIDLTEADLLDMPEDPDAAIAWIESLAATRENTR